MLAQPFHNTFFMDIMLHTLANNLRSVLLWLDEYYGMTYVPSGGRDSWSAYRISDETLDDNDEFVYQSAKKDYDVMKRVNKQIVSLLTYYTVTAVLSLCFIYNEASL